MTTTKANQQHFEVDAMMQPTIPTVKISEFERKSSKTWNYAKHFIFVAKAIITIYAVCM